MAASSARSSLSECGPRPGVDVIQGENRSKTSRFDLNIELQHAGINADESRTLRSVAHWHMITLQKALCAAARPCNRTLYTAPTRGHHFFPR